VSGTARGRVSPDIIVGLMSGTSLDGVSAAVVRIGRGDRSDAGYSSELLGALTRPYAPAERARLVRAADAGGGLTPEEWCQLNFDVGAWLADAAAAALAAARVDPSAVRAIASHGQTVWHIGGRSTWQIGEPAVIAERIGRPVVSNFRVRDVAAGGQGAPLVPMADLLLFASRTASRALQNVGGIANVTVVPALPPRRGLPAALEGVRAFDTGPGVIVIDAVVRALRPELPYDVDGALAASGSPITEVVDALLADAYFATPPPKSTGREHFSASYAANLMARCRSTRPSATDADLVATAVALTARSIADAYSRFVPEPVADIVASGGGTRNAALMAAIAAALAPRPVRRFSDLFFDDTAKEAVAFALLGYLHLHGQPGNIPRATGARGPRILGTLTPA
jgi:anhydro-N-acetylmuramic acid kinase